MTGTVASGAARRQILCNFANTVMLFNIEADEGTRIVGYVVLDAFTGSPSVRINNGNRELMILRFGCKSSQIRAFELLLHFLSSPWTEEFRKNVGARLANNKNIFSPGWGIIGKRYDFHGKSDFGDQPIEECSKRSL